MKKFSLSIIFFIFFIFIISPVTTHAANAGLIATPQSPIVEKDKVLYLPTAASRDVSFKVRFCGDPRTSGQPETVSIQAWVSYGGQEGLHASITNAGKPSGGNCKGDLKYYGDITTVSWTVPSSVTSSITINIRNENTSPSALSITLSDPPGGGGDPPGEQTGVEDTLSFGNLSDITNHLRPNVNFDSPEDIVSTILNMLLLIAGISSILAIIWSGWLLITSGGDTGKAEKAKKGVIWSATGLLLIMFAELIINATKIF